MPKLFKAPIKQQSAQELADHLPQGRAWDLKNDINSYTRKLLRSLSVSYNQIEQKVEELHEELDINDTLALLPDWENSVLLPDSCLGSLTEVQERRDLVIRRLQRKTIVTLAEFQEIVDQFFPGLGITLYTAEEFFSFEYDMEMTFFGSTNEKFILVAEVAVSGERFEYEFEILLEGGPDIEKLRCFIEEFLPSNVYLIIVFTG